MNLDLKRLTLQQTAALLCLSVRQINNLAGKGVTYVPPMCVASQAKTVSLWTHSRPLAEGV